MIVRHTFRLASRGPTTRSLQQLALRSSFTTSDTPKLPTVKIEKTTKDYYENENKIATYKSEIREGLMHRDYDEAKESAESALNLSVSHFGLNHPVSASCHSDLALINKELGNYEDSRELYLKASNIYEKTVGKEHPSYATMINNLGWSFRSQASGSEARAMDKIMLKEKALECFNECYKIRCENLGEDHADTI